MAQKIITIILGFAIIAALAWYINKNYIQNNGSSVDITFSSSASPNTNKNTNQAGTLVYTNLGAAKEIKTVDSSGRTRTIFTDADETDKIVNFSNVASEKGEVLVSTSADGAKIGGLEIVNLSTTKTSKVKTNFAIPDYLSLSPDSLKFAYVRFSNVEANYGYTLYYESVSGSDPITVITSDSEIIAPAFSPSSAKLAYATSDTAKSELNLYSITSKKLEKIATLDGKIIDWLSWPEPEKIYLATRKIGENNAGEIDSIDSASGAIEKIVQFSGGRASYIYVSKTASKLAFIVAQYKNKVDPQTSGQIYVVNLSTKEKNTLEKGNQILGWVANK